MHLYHRTANIKSYNPQLLVLAGKPDDRPWLTDLGHLITKIGSFMILADIETVSILYCLNCYLHCHYSPELAEISQTSWHSHNSQWRCEWHRTFFVNLWTTIRRQCSWSLALVVMNSFIRSFVIRQTQLTQRERYVRRCAGKEWLRERKMRAFYLLLHECTHEQGCQALLQATGLGCIAPNVVLLGFKFDWDTRPHSDLLTYYRMIRFVNLFIFYFEFFNIHHSGEMWLVL